MTDPFGPSSASGLLFGNSIEHRVNINAIRRQRAINAFRNNIALPDVHIADRTQEYTPLVVGEDGQELTMERRQQLMKEAGVRPMFDENGRPTGQQYVSEDGSVFDSVIEQERLGETAENNRPGVRVVVPRDLPLLADLSEESVQIAQSGTFIPGAKDPNVAITSVGTCLYTSGFDAIIDLASFSREAKRAIFAVIKAGPNKVAARRVRMTSRTKLLIREMFRANGASLGLPDGAINGTLFGIPVEIDNRMETEIRFYADESYPELANKYSTIFMHKDLYDMWGIVDPAADTEIIRKDNADPRSDG